MTLPTACPDGVKGVHGVGSVHNIVLGLVVEPTMVFQSVGTPTTENVPLKDCPTGACVAVEVSSGPVVATTSLHPVVEDVRVGVAMLLQLCQTRPVTVVAGADVDCTKVTDDASSPVVHMVVLDVEHVATAVVFPLLHRTSHPFGFDYVKFNELWSPDAGVC